MYQFGLKVTKNDIFYLLSISKEAHKYNDKL
jgi:hypothetical protein